jgi:hypothetical protein
LVACSSSDSGSAIVLVTPATAQSFASALCSKLNDCGVQLFVTAGYGSVDNCAARFVQQFQLDIKSPAYAVTDSDAKTCIAQIPSATCADMLTGKLPDPCNVKGSLADGATCTADAECSSGSCFVADAATCGKCGPRVAAGADCTNANCERGLKCSSGNVCTTGQTGAACLVDDDCHFPVASSCINHACAAPLDTDAPCASNPGTTDPHCDLTKSLYCKPDAAGAKTGKCSTLSITNVATGAACGLIANPLGVAFCTDSVCTTNKCVGFTADGASCTSSAQCAPPATCRNGLCGLKDPTVCK